MICTSKDGSPCQMALLERAIRRLDLHDDDLVRGISVDGSDCCLRVTIDVACRPRRVAHEAERAFARVWYDAFGERDPRHAGRLVERGAAP